MNKGSTKDETIAKINRRLADFKDEFDMYMKIRNQGRRMFLESQTMEELAAGLKMVRLARHEMESILATQGKAIAGMMNTLYDFAIAENDRGVTSKIKAYIKGDVPGDLVHYSGL